MNGSKLKIALIGTGGWARQHARILASRPEVDFCGIVGRNEERTALRAAEYKTRAYTSFEKLVKNEMPDFICVCLPNQHHFAATLEVINAGLPLLVEKPLVFDLNEAQTLIAEAEKRDLFFAINFNRRSQIHYLG
ncbi:MAG: Gfo/Idh/MocA family oxidoreductase [Trueperaceae bacterium]|nr:Gfo/Idh/MocA family oxidoreductase [Trueperaceae bacterium]